MIFTHTCTECGHTDLNHDTSIHKGSACSYGWCPCTTTRRQVAMREPVETAPTFLPRGGESVRVWAPGANLGGDGAPTIACDCNACHSAYAEYMGVPA